MSKQAAYDSTPVRGVNLERQLVEASRNGEKEVVEILLKRGVCANASEYNKSLFYQSLNYVTPVQNAACHGFTEILQILINAAADINSRDRFDVTALHMAAEHGHTDCLQLLLDEEAESNVGTKYSKHGSYKAFPHPGGTTPLHLAASNNQIECVKKLIWNGADYNTTDEYGRTSLYIAAEESLDDCVHAHLDSAVWKAILSLPSKETGNTPLHLCVMNSMIACVQKLLSHGSDVNCRNSQLLSPLHLAVHTGRIYSLDMVRELVTNGYNVDVNIPEANGHTPLHYVCFQENSKQERRQEAAVLLIAHGADYKITNRNGANVLQNELQSRHSDRTILHAICKSEGYLPSLESLQIMVHPFNRHVAIPDHYYRNPRFREHFQIHSEVQMNRLTWYRDLCKHPRPLQHYCRFVIRKTMGVKRLSKIKTLPLPNTLKDYLLLLLEDFAS